MKHQRFPISKLKLNDDGDHVEITDRMNMIFAYKDTDNIVETTGSKNGIVGISSDPRCFNTGRSFTGRFTPLEGDRSEATFGTRREANRWVRAQQLENYTAEFLRLRLFNTYFGA